MSKPELEEIEKILKQGAADFLDEDDALDKLINDIISIEKQHRHISAGGKDRKQKQIIKLIDEYIKTDDEGNLK